MPTDTFDDLATLADAQPPDPRYGRLLVRTGQFWSYPGCVLDGANLKVPRANVGHARVLAAITAGVWFAWEVDATGQPVKAMPVTSIWAGRPPITPADVGTARTHPPIATYDAQLYRGGLPVYNLGVATWLSAWQAGLSPASDGQGIPDAQLTVRLAVNPPAGSTPQADDVLVVEGRRYCARVVVPLGSNTYDVLLTRFVTPAVLAA